jgi:hypothetical protein
MKITNFNDLSVLTERFTANKFYDSTFYELVKSYLGKKGISKQYNVINNFLNLIDPKSLDTQESKVIIAEKDQTHFVFDNISKFVFVEKNGVQISTELYDIDYKNNTVIINASVAELQYKTKLDLNEEYIIKNNIDLAALGYYNVDLSNSDNFSDEFLVPDIYVFKFFSKDFEKFIEQYAPIISNLLKLNIMFSYDNPYKVLRTIYEMVDKKGMKDVYYYLSKTISFKQDSEFDMLHTFIDKHDIMSYTTRELEILESSETRKLWYVNVIHDLDVEPIRIGSRNKYQLGYKISDSNLVTNNSSNITPFVYIAKGTFSKKVFNDYFLEINHPMGWDIIYELYQKLEVEDALKDTIDDIKFSIKQNLENDICVMSDDPVIHNVRSLKFFESDGEEMFYTNDILINGLYGALQYNNRKWLVGDESIRIGYSYKQKYSDSFNIETL